MACSQIILVHDIELEKITSITVAITYITKAEIITKTAGMIAATTKSNLWVRLHLLVLVVKSMNPRLHTFFVF